MMGFTKFLTERAIRRSDYRTLRFTTGSFLTLFAGLWLEDIRKYIYYSQVIFGIWNLLKAQIIPGFPTWGQAFPLEPTPQ